MMDFNFGEGTDANVLGLLSIELREGGEKMMDFSFRDGTESEALKILGIRPRAKGGGQTTDFNFRDETTDANALRLLSIGLREEGEQMMEQKPVAPPPWGSSTLPPTRVQWSPSLHTTHAL